jgi:flagellar hook protein FlgE
MGIFGAMTTAITGLRAQSNALENISNNIANSQTVGYKRTDTTFAELVPISDPRDQALGVVQSFSRPTNAVQGDISNTDNSTFIAINGDGYFIVGQQTDTIDGNPVFSDEDLYTRRGDYELDRNGYLVNGAGYFLKGLPIDSTTGNVVGSVPDEIQVSNDLLPAQATTEIDYRANLPTFPITANSDATITNSQSMHINDFNNDPRVGGDGYVEGQDASAFLDRSISGGAITTFDQSGQAVNVQLRWAKVAQFETGDVDISGTLTGEAVDGDQLDLTINGQSVAIEFNTTGTPSGAQDAALDINTATGADLVSTINTLFGFTAATFDGNNFLQLTPPDNGTMQVGYTGTGDIGQDTIAASVTPSPTWNLFYLEDSTAAGTNPAWRNSGTDYVFGTDGQLNPPISSITINNLTVDGVNLGNIQLDHGSGGITQFADANGITNVTALTQNGYAAGELTGISISDEGRVVATYTNGRAVDLAQVTLASFSANGFLQKLDGGAWRATQESGQAQLGAQGSIIGSSLESSNTDIADEFTKLIVTQQAYAANTRVISTSDEMIQEALNIIR